MDKADRFVKIFKEESSIANNVGDGNIAGTKQAGDDPPKDPLLFAKIVRRRKKNKSCEQGKYGRWITAAINSGKKKGKMA